jgi:phospholipid/cholesterol/gamma-HCH transport system permease protein
MRADEVRQPAWRVERRGADAVVRLSGDWLALKTGVRDDAAVRGVLDQAGGARYLVLEGVDLGRWDSALIAFVKDLRDAALAVGAKRPELDDTGLPAPARRLLTLAAGSDAGPLAIPRPASASALSRVGRLTAASFQELAVVTALLGDVVLRAGAALAGRLRSRSGDVIELMRDAGAGALGIVAIASGLVGGILAFVGAVQLRRLGTEIFVADLVGIAMAREMAAIMTAVVMAGRTGGAYAAHIATMQGNEEIDALRALGVPIRDYLVMPRVIALMAMMPLLYAYACAVGLLGGFVVSLVTLDLTPVAYLNETQRAVTGTHLLIGLTKSVAFGAVVALTGCHIGLRAGRSAAEVGRAATSAVVAGIIGVIALDAVFAVCTDALRI